MLGENNSAIATYEGSLKKFFIAIAMQLDCPTEDGNDKPLTVDALKEEIMMNAGDNTLKQLGSVRGARKRLGQ